MVRPTDMDVTPVMSAAYTKPTALQKPLQQPQPDRDLEAQKLYGSFRDVLSRLVDEATLTNSLDQDNQHLTGLNEILERILLHGFRNRRQWLLNGGINRTITSADDSAALVLPVATESAPHLRRPSSLQFSTIHHRLSLPPIYCPPSQP
ncbi:hypothetical protein BASA61_005664 [Batrachochytrium salamandrivorans]|nr:hypothetical protein BASA61_005664 [Batrachochytrium salamandrivorans]